MPHPGPPGAAELALEPALPFAVNHAVRADEGMKLVLQAHVDGPHRQIVRATVQRIVLFQPPVPGDGVQEGLHFRTHEPENGQNVPPGTKEVLRISLETPDDFARELWHGQPSSVQSRPAPPFHGPGTRRAGSIPLLGALTICSNGSFPGHQRYPRTSHGRRLCTIRIS